jgi:hypothetical protein
MYSRRLVNSLAFAVACSISVAASAMILTPPVRIKTFTTYTDYGNGDVVFLADTTFPGCDGFWLSPADAGFKQAYAALMMVKASDTSVVLYAYDTSLWPGSASVKYCRIRTISPE